MASLLGTLVSSFAPIFLMISPLTSYTDQILSIHRTHTSAGFSLDIPLIMLSASILKIFYWPGARYDLALLIQAVIMVGVQIVLLKVALDNRPDERGRKDLGPFVREMELEKEKRRGGGGGGGGGRNHNSGGGGGRPWGFWRWRRQRPYWECVGALVLGLMIAHTIIKPTPLLPSSSSTTAGATTKPMNNKSQPTTTISDLYTPLIGYLGLAIEAILPIPQILSNHRARSCKGFRVSVLVNWLVGDAMKMGFFYMAEEGKIPLAFKLCALFQAGCDLGLGLQWWVFGDGVDVRDGNWERERDKERGG